MAPLKLLRLLLRELDISGTVDQYDQDVIVINQIQVLLDTNTQTIGSPTNGSYVAVKAYRTENNLLMARQVQVINPGRQPSQNPTATSSSANENPDSAPNTGTSANKMALGSQPTPVPNLSEAPGSTPVPLTEVTPVETNHENQTTGIKAQTSSENPPSVVATPELNGVSSYQVENKRGSENNQPTVQNTTAPAQEEGESSSNH